MRTWPQSYAAAEVFRLYLGTFGFTWTPSILHRSIRFLTDTFDFVTDAFDFVTSVFDFITDALGSSTMI